MEIFLIQRKLLPKKTSLKRVEIWFQDEARVGKQCCEEVMFKATVVDLIRGHVYYASYSYKPLP